MTTDSFRALVQAVLASSESNVWETAVLEWAVIDLDEDPLGQGTCVCGQPNLVQMFTIKNLYNDDMLYPIGNVCVKKFGRHDLSLEVDLFSEMHKLRKAISEGNVDLTSKYFSRALLGYLHSEGAFTPDQWNHFDGEEDYIFLLKMFNKRNKDTITSKQQWKIDMLLQKKIFPFVSSED